MADEIMFTQVHGMMARVQRRLDRLKPEQVNLYISAFNAASRGMKRAASDVDVREAAREGVFKGGVCTDARTYDNPIIQRAVGDAIEEKEIEGLYGEARQRDQEGGE